MTTGLAPTDIYEQGGMIAHLFGFPGSRASKSACAFWYRRIFAWRSSFICSYMITRRGWVKRWGETSVSTNVFIAFIPLLYLRVFQPSTSSRVWYCECVHLLSVALSGQTHWWRTCIVIIFLSVTAYATSRQEKYRAWYSAAPANASLEIINSKRTSTAVLYIFWKEQSRWLYIFASRHV